MAPHDGGYVEMCGIIARVGNGGALEELMAGLENLEYRGYDSAGIAIQSGGTIEVCKREGETSELRAALEGRSLPGNSGLGHTRWSTHGRPSDANAHPHTDCQNRVAVAHNGIIQNHGSLRAELRERGHRFESETDTEVVPHLIAEELDLGMSPEAAFRAAVDRLEGSYALAVTIDSTETVFATRHGSPLVLGVGYDATYVASDAPAFLDFTDTVVYLEEDDYVAIAPDGYRITDASGTPLERPVESINWDAGDAQKGAYSHFMRKEIDEQPVALRQALEGRIEDGTATLEQFPPGSLSDIEHVVFVACGTSYHAAMYGSVLLRRAGVTATVARSNEFAYDPTPLDDRTLVIAVTQSGETADTLAALRVAAGSPSRTLAVTNVVGSTAAREADHSLFIQAGPEIGVAATKTFSSQVATLALLAGRFVADRDSGGDSTDRIGRVLDGLDRLPAAVETVVGSAGPEALAREFSDASSYFFLGRGVGYPVALEGALKFKEITYDHAEGFAAGELKHGPLALVTEDTVIVAVFTGRHDEKTLHNVREAQSRGASVIGVGPESAVAARDTVEEYLSVPALEPELVGVLANVHLQLLAYHAAAIRGRSIDKPRNLAKSVTVE